MAIELQLQSMFNIGLLDSTRTGDVKACKYYLINEGADPKTTYAKPIFFDIEHSVGKILASLVNSAVSILSAFNQGDQLFSGNNALHYNAMEGNPEITALLMTPNDGRDAAWAANQPNKEGNLPAHYAAKNGHTEILAKLLALDIDGKQLNHRNREGQTILDVASTDEIRALVEMHRKRETTVSTEPAPAANGIKYRNDWKVRTANNPLRPDNEVQEGQSR